MSQSFFRWFLFATGILKEVEVEKKAPKGILDSTLSFFGVKDNAQKIIVKKVMLNTSSPAFYILLFIFTIFVIFLVIKIRQFRSRGSKVASNTAPAVKSDKRKSWLFNRAPAVTENQNDTKSESKVVQPSKADIINRFNQTKGTPATRQKLTLDELLRRDSGSDSSSSRPLNPSVKVKSPADNEAALKEKEREKELQRQREKEKELQREKERAEQREKDLQRQKEKEKEQQRQRELQEQREKERKDQKERETQRAKELQKEKELQREKEKELQKEKEKQREREKELQREKEREIQRQKELQRQAEKESKKETWISKEESQAVSNSRPLIDFSTDNNVDSLFQKFIDTDDFMTSLQIHEKMKSILKVTTGDEFYEQMKARTARNVLINPLFKLLDKKKAISDYKLNSVHKPKVLVIGAGVAGLRTAIEFCLLGATVTVLEKRKAFTRHNLLHIWDSTISDLTTCGIKFFYPKFCTGGIHHVSIKRLQLLLTKIALLCGTNIVPGFSFAGVEENPSDEDSTYGPLWTAKISETEDVPPKSVLQCNVLIGADGQNSNVAKLFNFERKVFKGSEAIGITANFLNKQSKAEISLNEFGLMSVYNKPFFNELKDKYDIDLENLVYYRGETHYFVMTAKRDSLLKRGVIKANTSDIMNPSNISYEKLKEYVRIVASHVKLPDDLPFIANHKGEHDVQIFDFSSRQESTEPFKWLKNKETGHELPVALVGDALVEPFWPLGTGANRAVLSSLDTTWAMKIFFESGRKQTQTLRDHHKYFRLLLSSSPSDLAPAFNKHTINPDTRYKKNRDKF
jgi:hypothetical protein